MENTPEQKEMERFLKIKANQIEKILNQGQEKDGVMVPQSISPTEWECTISIIPPRITCTIKGVFE